MTHKKALPRRQAREGWEGKPRLPSGGSTPLLDLREKVAGLGTIFFSGTDTSIDDVEDLLSWPISLSAHVRRRFESPSEGFAICHITIVP